MALAGAIVLVVVLGGDDTPAEPALSGSTLAVSLADYSITGNLQVPAGPIRIEATNVGGLQHNIGVRGVKISRNLARGESTILDLGTLGLGSYELYCDVVDSADNVSHVAKGMVAKLVVAAG